MKLSEQKCHLLVSGHKHKKVWARIGKSGKVGNKNY